MYILTKKFVKNLSSKTHNHFMNQRAPKITCSSVLFAFTEPSLTNTVPNCCFLMCEQSQLLLACSKSTMEKPKH